MMKKYYVYEWYNEETGVIFYVGKGTGRRMYNTQGRNRYFKRYIQQHRCGVRKIQEFDTENEALQYEKQRISELKEKSWCFCNFDEGGRNGGRAFGENNGMYHKTHTIEVKKRLREINSDGRHSGANNSQYGISPRQRMKPDIYEKWREHFIRKGKNNSQYGISPKKRMSPEVYHSWLKSQNKGEKGKNPNAKKIKMFNEIEERNFDSIVECALFIQLYICKKPTKLSSIQNNISAAVHKQQKYHHYYFNFI